MVEFMSGYQPPMDREFELPEYNEFDSAPIEAPIIPISEIGTTWIDSGGGNILTNLDKVIRMGTKKVQLVIAGGQAGSPSALASSYGKDVRRELREKAKSSGVDIVGIEVSPQRVQGLTGFNPQSSTISEEQRIHNIEQVKDVLKMAADIGAPSVDVWGNEFSRNIIDADWNGKDGFKFYDYTEKELTEEGIKESQMAKYLVDKRTGNIIRESVVRTNDRLHRVKFKNAKDEGLVGKKDKNGEVFREDDYVDLQGNRVDRWKDDDWYKKVVPVINKDKQYEMETLDWNQMVKEAEKYNKEHGLAGKEAITTEEYVFRQRIATQIAQARGQSLYYGFDLDLQLGQIKELMQQRDFIKSVEQNMDDEQKRRWIMDNALPLLGGRRGGGVPEEIREQLLKRSPSEVMQDIINRQYSHVQGTQEMVRSHRTQELEYEDMRNNVVRPDRYAKEKTFDSYSEVGLQAWKLTKERNLKNPLHVGPELGFAGQSYGGHPDEFIEIVKESRRKLAEKLEREGLAKEAAQEQAKKHIKGMLDTSHLSMWYKHLAPKPGESEEQKLKRFDKWMKDNVRKMVKEGVVGGVQVVDSITGEHAHLPVGQGMFDMVGLIKAMKEEGFDGPIISEGHEEEQFGQGRILSSTWAAFGSPVRSVLPGQRGGTWRGVQNSYFGYQMPHTHIVGGYSPGSDWQLWSDTPFE